MNWKFWQRNNKLVNDGELTINEVSERLRGFILDSQINNAHEIAVILGASISSEEVMEKEEEESDKRVQKVSYMVPLLYSQSHALAEGATEFQRVAASQIEDMPKLPEEVWIESRKLMEQVSLACALGAISQAVDMGLLEIPKRRKRKR